MGKIIYMCVKKWTTDKQGKMSGYPAPNAENKDILKGGFQSPLNNEVFSPLAFKPLSVTRIKLF